MNLKLNDMKDEFKPVRTRGMFWGLFIQPFITTLLWIVGCSTIYILLAYASGGDIPNIDLNTVLLSTYGKISAVLVFYIGGYLLFVFKKNQQYWYGIFESAFALSSSYFLIDKLQSELTQKQASPLIWLTAISAIYLVVRGFSNVDEGRKKPYLFKNKLAWKVITIDPETGEQKPAHWD